MIKLEILGLKELDQALRQFGPKVAKNGLRAANYAGTKIIVEATRALIKSGGIGDDSHSSPGSPPMSDSGLLKVNIVSPRRRGPPTTEKHSVVVRGTRKSRVTKVARGRKSGKYHQVAGPAVYGRMLEYGTKKMAARPFMRPALFNNAEKAIGAIAEGMKKAVDRAAKKAGRL